MTILPYQREALLRLLDAGLKVFGAPGADPMLLALKLFRGDAETLRDVRDALRSEQGTSTKEAEGAL